MLKLTDILIGPKESEKTVRNAKQLKSKSTKYAFDVHLRANKQLVTNAIKLHFGHIPTKVNMIKLPVKTKLITKGKVAMKRSLGKVAIVTFSDGFELNFNNFS